VPLGGLWECRSVSGGDATQNGAPPPPPPPTGSPFGRFVTQPVFLVALLALMVSLPVVALALRGDGGGASEPSDTPAVVAGEWAGPALGEGGAGGGVDAVNIELTIDSGGDGTLAVGRCRGVLSSRRTRGRSLVFAYIGQGDRVGCPQRSTVGVTPLPGDRLRIEQRRGRRIVAEGVLRAR
jgi:hypothetical protein